VSGGTRRIAEAFRLAREQGRAALIPFLTAGDPDATATRALVLEMARRGADIVELGIPFSDPLADGATIQRASQRALAAGFSLRRALDLAAEIRRAAPVPLVFMSYANPVLSFGAAAFAAAAAAAGVDGAIVPDLPPEEAEELTASCDRHGVSTIFLVAPTTAPARIPLICARSRGYIYYVSLRGVTGVRSGLPQDLAAGIARVRAATDLPVAVGFGIATPEQVADVAREADGVIVGSAIVQAIEAHRDRPDMVDRVGAFVGTLRAATARPAPAGRR
jgi:tryptophan synthase alpha chain